jgi:hypothetical protein
MNLTNNPMLWGIAIALLAGGAWAVKDYREWKSLGKGGVPYNVYGWLMVTRFRFEARDTLDTAQYADRIGGLDDSVRLPELPRRQGPRPRMGKHPVPHRQMDQKPEDNTARKLLDQVFDRFVDQNGSYVRYAKSFYEKRNDAVTLVDLYRSRPLSKLSQGEVAHIHPSDGSMHMIFSPSDAKQVIDKGWGERHPLCGAPRHNIPDTYLMIYTPRDANEVAVIKQLLRGAVEHMGACRCEAV